MPWNTVCEYLLNESITWWGIWVIKIIEVSWTFQKFLYLLTFVHTVPSWMTVSHQQSTRSPALSLWWLRPFKSQLKNNFLREAFSDISRLHGVSLFSYFLILWSSTVLALNFLLIFLFEGIDCTFSLLET